MNKIDMPPAWTDPDDAPDLSAPEWQAKMEAAVVTRPRGRPRSDAPKALTTLRLAPDVLAAFKATGPGWQTRIEAALWDTIERLKREKTPHSADEVRLLQRQKADGVMRDLTDAEYRKRALDDMIERRKKAAGVAT